MFTRARWFLFFLVLTASPGANAQVMDGMTFHNALPFSIAVPNLPFASLLQEEDNNHLLVGNSRLDSLFTLMYENSADTTKGKLSQTGKWVFSHLICHSQHGMIDQNQAYMTDSRYVPADSLSSFTAPEIISEFSRDTLFSLNPAVHQTFYSDDLKEGTWYFAQSGDLLVVRLYRNLAAHDLTKPESLSRFYHNEEYIYFFRKL